MLQMRTLLLQQACKFSIKNLRFRAKWPWIRRQICLFRWKTSKFQSKTYRFFNFWTPYCAASKIEHPTCRVVGTPKYAPASPWYYCGLKRNHNRFGLPQPLYPSTQSFIGSLALDLTVRDTTSPSPALSSHHVLRSTNIRNLLNLSWPQCPSNTQW